MDDATCGVMLLLRRLNHVLEDTILLCVTPLDVATSLTEVHREVETALEMVAPIGLDYDVNMVRNVDHDKQVLSHQGAIPLL